MACCVLRLVAWLSVPDSFQVRSVYLPHAQADYAQYPDGRARGSKRNSHSLHQATHWQLAMSVVVRAVSQIHI